MKKPIRILQDNVIMDQGGIESLLMNVYRLIDKNKVQFDFLVHRSQEGYYDSEIESLGGHVYHTSPYNPLKNNRNIREMENLD